MREMYKFGVVSAVIILAACAEDSDPRTERVADLVQLCERADIQESILDIFVEAMFKRNKANAGLLGSIYDQGLSEEKARQETSIENARAKRHSPEQVDCTVDFVGNVSSDNEGMNEVKFADAQYSLIQQRDNTYQVVPKKASFFVNLFIDGTPRDAWMAEQQIEAQSARETEEEAALSSDSSNGNQADEEYDNSDTRPATAEEEADIRRIAEEHGMAATPHGNGFDLRPSDE